MHIDLSADGTQLVITDAKGQIDFVRKLPGRHWHGDQACWTVPYVNEAYRMLEQAGKPVKHILPPKTSAYRVFRPPGKDYFVLQTLGTPSDVARAKKIPEHRMFSQQEAGWLFKPSRGNVLYVDKAFPDIVWEDGCQLALNRYTRQAPAVDRLLAEVEPNDFRFKTVPFKHQKTGFYRSRDAEYFGLLMEPGTGKTKLAIDTTAYLFLKGEIDALLVICPNTVKDTWLEELQAHLPDDIKADVFLWEPKTRHKIDAWIHRTEEREKPLRILVMNVEAFSTDTGVLPAQLFLAKHRSILVVDESTRIKSPSAKRTKRIIKLGRDAFYRRILSGHPAPQSPLDLYSQLKFLHQDTLPFSTYFSFRNHFALLGGFNGKVVVGYANLEELQGYVNKVSYRVLKADCLDLPDKVYERRTVTLSAEQRRLYQSMRDEMLMEMQGIEVTVEYVLQKLNKLARITGGFFSYETLSEDADMTTKHLIQIDGPNPKLDALLEIIDDTDDKVIIWANFRAELDLIYQTLEEKYGKGSAVLFRGIGQGVTSISRQEGRRAFQGDENGPRFFVGQPQAGGIGITLTKSATVVYFSNAFSLEDRLQSEDRAHRISQARTVVYTDLVAKGTLDVRLLAVLRRKKNIADLITGDKSLSWI